MSPFQTEIRISYSDTDQMGYMHHSNYLKYYETARWELFRSIGIPYFELEQEGIILPVIDITIKYIKPIHYDQKIVIKTIIKRQAGARIIFDYKTENEAGEIINEAEISVAFAKKSSGKACMPPEKIKDAIKQLIDSYGEN